MEREQIVKNLFEETKDLYILGPRLTDDPEILCEIQDWSGIKASRAQIRRVLEYVPHIFPENWLSPDGFEDLNEDQKKAYFDIAYVGPFRLVGPDIEQIIQQGLWYRRRYGNIGKFHWAVADAADILTEVGIKREDWMVISGGAVYLYQFKKGILSDRVPTDLDIVINSDKENILEKLASVQRYFNESHLVKEPRTHFGFKLTNPILETVTREGFSVDFMTDMTPICPDDHVLLPGVHYKFPDQNNKLFELTRRIKIEELEGEIQIANPAFIAFYKILVSRNSDGKQDYKDIRRLKEMGFLERNSEFEEVMRIMCKGHERLFEGVIAIMDQL